MTQFDTSAYRAIMQSPAQPAQHRSAGVRRAQALSGRGLLMRSYWSELRWVSVPRPAYAAATTHTPQFATKAKALVILSEDSLLLDENFGRFVRESFASSN